MARHTDSKQNKTLKAGYSNTTCGKNKSKTPASKSIKGFKCFWECGGDGALECGSTRVGLAERVEEILWGQPLHVGGSVGAKGLGCCCIALATTLHLVQDNSGQHDEEDAAKGTAECNQNSDTVGVVFG